MADTQPSASIGGRVARGARLMIALRITERLMGLASFSVLARILMPEDFGVLALATSAIAVIELFGQAGIDLALIQRRRAGPDEYNTAWTINVIIGAAMAVLIVLLARPIAVLMNEARLDTILYCLAAASLLSGTYNVGTVEFQKYFEFGKEFLFRISIRLIRTVITIALALVWRNYWALVAGYLTGTAALVLLSYLFHPYRPRPSLSALPMFLSFSRWMLVRNILTGLNDHLGNLVVGRQASANALGFFAVGREISSLATTELQAPIRRALFPGFAALSEDATALRSSYLRWAAMMVLLTVPIPAGLILVAGDIVLLLMGDHWLPVVPLIQILAAGGILRASASGAQSVFIAIGRPELSARLAAIRFLVLTPTIVVGAEMAGARGAAWAMLGTALVMFGINLSFVRRALQLDAAALFRVTHRPLIAMLAMMPVVWLATRMLPSGAGFTEVMVRLVACTLVGGLVYVVAVLGLWVRAGRPHSAEKDVLSYLSLRTLPA